MYVKVAYFSLFIVVFVRGYVGIHSSGFRDFLLKPELLRAIVDSGFEHPSEGMLLFHFFCQFHWLKLETNEFIEILLLWCYSSSSS